MEEVGEKLKNMFSFGKSKKFTGHGHKLGGSESGPRPPTPIPVGVPNQPVGVSRLGGASSSGGARAPSLPSTVSPPEPRRVSRLAQSTTASSGGSSGGDAAMQPGTSFTSAAAAAAQPAAYGSQARAPALQLGRSSPHSPSGDGGGSSSTSTSPKAPLQLVQHMRRCVATICGQEGSRACLETLALVLRNIVAKPDEPKYRQIKLSNAKIQQNVLTFDGPLELLEAAGFAMLPAAAAAAAAAPAGNGGGAAEGSSSGEELCLMLATDLPMSPVRAALAEVETALGPQQQQAFTFAPTAPTGAAAAAAAGAAAAPRAAAQPAAAASVSVPRNTAVVLPVTPDTEVPDWFFQATGAELKEMWKRMVGKREAGEQLTTRAYKERQAAAAAAGGGGGGPAPSVATVRVRFPEGVCLQGEFHGSEPTSAVFEWVSGCLRWPALEYELITPSRKPLQRGGGTAAASTVRSADLLPSMLLNFRPLLSPDDAAALARRPQPMLADELLGQTRLD